MVMSPEVWARTGEIALLLTCLFDDFIRPHRLVLLRSVHSKSCHELGCEAGAGLMNVWPSD